MAGENVQVTVGAKIDGLVSGMNEAAEVMQTSTAKMSESMGGLGSAFEGLGRRFEHSGVMIAFAVNNMLDGTQTGVERALHSIALLGFAFGPVVGAVTTALALIADTIKNKLKESSKELEEFQKKMADAVNAGDVAALMKEREKLLTGTPMVDGKRVGKSDLVPGAWKGSLEDLGAEYRKLAAAKAEADKSLVGASAVDTIQKEMNRISAEYSAKKKELDAVEDDLATAEQQRERIMAGGDLATRRVSGGLSDAAQKKKEAEQQKEIAKGLQTYLNEQDKTSEKSFEKLLDEQLRKSGEAARKRMHDNDETNKQEAELQAGAARQAAEAIAKGNASLAREAQLAARTTAEGWMKAMEQIQSAFEKAFAEMQRHGGTFTEYMRKVGQQLLGDFARNELKMVEAHIAANLIKTDSDTKSTETSKTLRLADALSSISSSAAKAAGEAFSAMAGIPVVGPELGAVAAAASFAAVMAFGTLASAAGGFDVPRGMNPVTQLHSEEMVLPAPLANAVRGMAEGGGTGGGDVHLHIHAIDSVDTARWARQNSRALGEAALTHIQRGGSTPNSAGRR